MSLSKQKIDSLLEEAENIDHELTTESLASLISTLKTKYTNNISLRTKYPKDSMKFCLIEESLHEDIVFLQRLGAYPSLIPTFISSGGIETLTMILHHPNSDIIDAVVTIIEEITSSDFLTEIEDAKSFLELFISNGLFDLLSENLNKVASSNDEDTFQYESNMLSVIENFMDVYPLSNELICDTNVINWLIEKVKTLENSADIAEGDVRVFASELLATMVQYSEKNQKKFAKLEGVPQMINLIVNMKENANTTIQGTYEEYVNNVFDCICGALMINENREMFSKADGVNIMIDLMRENDIFRHLAIKVLNYALQNNESNCLQFIKGNGLCVLFPYFMCKGMNRLKNETKTLGIEYSIEIINNLLRYSNGVELDRVIYKFRENKSEKAKQLLQYYTQYSQEGKDKYIKCIICAIIAKLLKTEFKSHFTKLYEANSININDIFNVLKEQIEESEDSYKQYIKSLIN